MALRKQLTDQIEFIAWLKWFHKDAVGAMALLREFERELAGRMADRERLSTQLAHLDRPAASREPEARHTPMEAGIPQLQSAV